MIESPSAAAAMLRLCQDSNDPDRNGDGCSGCIPFQGAQLSPHWATEVMAGWALALACPELLLGPADPWPRPVAGQGFSWLDVSSNSISAKLPGAVWLCWGKITPFPRATSHPARAVTATSSGREERASWACWF